MPYIEIIKQLMQEYNLSQQGFADILEVNQTTVSQWLLGKKKPGYDSILALYQKFDIEPKCTIQSFFKAAPLGTKKIVVTNELPHELICDTEVDDRHRLSVAVNDNGVVIGYAIFSINDLVPNLQKILQENSDYLVEISHEGIKIYEKELD